MKSKRSKACDITQKVREIVGERDNYSCVICGRPGIPNLHYIPRSAGGLGIEQNVVCGCYECHHEYDNGKYRKEHGQKILEHLQTHYPDFKDEDRYYKKWEF